MEFLPPWSEKSIYFLLQLKVSSVFLSIQSQHGVSHIYITRTDTLLDMAVKSKWEVCYWIELKPLSKQNDPNDFWGLVLLLHVLLSTITFEVEFMALLRRLKPELLKVNIVWASKENHLLPWWLYNHITHCELFKDSQAKISEGNAELFIQCKTNVIRR